MPTTPLLLSLYLAMGPMTVVEDGSTTLIQQAVRGGRWLGDEASLAVAASASGVAGAVLVGAQVEAVITAAHAKGSTIGESAAAAYRAGGLRALLVPHGLTMIAAREAPYCGCLFFLSGRIRERMRPSESQQPSFWRRTACDYCAAALTALIAGACRDPARCTLEDTS
mmetsp:Transcript_18761/g.56642  ORF Transcript_18761/g.56642 Transcript_18761/m.56642 type:complete len:168 (+) Transcript_18761:504-1007(+)